jgi:hypothetical protein
MTFVAIILTGFCQYRYNILKDDQAKKKEFQLSQKIDNLDQGNRILQDKLKPFEELANINYPGMGTDAALGRLYREIQDVRKETTILNERTASGLGYSFSRIEKEPDGNYIRTLIIESKGKLPVYNPVIFLRFDKLVKNASFEPYQGGVLSLVNLRTNSDLQSKLLNNTEYFFSTGEFVPGLKIKFIFSNDSEFDIIEFKLNNEKTPIK